MSWKQIKLNALKVLSWSGVERWEYDNPSPFEHLAFLQRMFCLKRSFIYEVWISKYIVYTQHNQLEVMNFNLKTDLFRVHRPIRHVFMSKITFDTLLGNLRHHLCNTCYGGRRSAEMTAYPMHTMRKVRYVWFWFVNT